MRAVSCVLAAFAVVFCFNLPAAQASVTFDLRGYGGLKPSYEFVVDGVKLTVTAGTFTSTGGVTTNFDDRVGQYSNGLGATTSRYDAHFVDGYNGNDILVFAFDRKVSFESIRFTYVDFNDDFHFFVSPDGTAANLADVSGTSGYPVSSTYTFTPPLWMGTVFGIGAKDANDEFKVKKVTVSVVKPPHKVPVPAALPILAGGLVMLAAVGRRRRRA